MDKDLLNKIGLYAATGSVISFLIGSMILNSHLSNFQIVDFNLLKPHAIWVGLAFVIFLVSNCLVVSLFLDMDKFTNNSNKRLILLTLSKGIFVCNFLFLVTGSEKYLNDSFFSLRVFGWSFNIGFHCFLASVIILTLFAMSFKFSMQNNPKNRFIRNLWFYTWFGANLIFFQIYRITPEYGKILSFEAMFFLGFLSLSLLTIGNRLDTTVSTWHGSVFSNEEVKGKHTVSLLFLFVFFMGAIALFSCITVYTSDVFPLLSQSFGGGKLEKMAYVCRNDTIIGNKIYENNENIFLHLKDSTILKLKWDDVTKILPRLGK